MSQLDVNKYNTSGSRHFAFAGYPSIKLYKSAAGSKWNNHLLFGDYIQIKDLQKNGTRVLARSRNTTGWVEEGELRKSRILEVNFVDIGQGDGCHVVTPDDKHIIIDAGKTDNMNRYLTWRFNLYPPKTKPLPLKFVIVISHSDVDHYKGFLHVFRNKFIPCDEIYHNGLVERPGAEPLGPEDGDYLVGLVKDTMDMKALLDDADNRKGDRSTYCKTLFESVRANPDTKFFSLSTKSEWLKDFDSNYQVDGKDLAIKVLGPLIEKRHGKEGLKSINDLGKDKNGHSVILKLVYDKATILLGGDVNTEFGAILHKYYSDAGKLADLQVDVAKACHHGSNHFHYDFVKAINSAATVISSGDEESYSHPRPDTIGALGKCGYGIKPLIFSTELARSNKEITFDKLKSVSKKFDRIKDLQKQRKALISGGHAPDSPEVKDLDAKLRKTNKEINSFSTKYGMINVRTDGRRMIIAQKYEVAAASGKWDVYALEYDPGTKRFEPVLS